MCVMDGLSEDPRCVPWVLPCVPYCKAADMAAAATKPVIDAKFKKVDSADDISTVAAGVDEEEKLANADR